MNKSIEKTLVVIDENMIKNKLYYIREREVMLDSDLAEIYGYTTMRFNEQVKNNIKRFDEDFMFQLTDNEYKNLISKKSISSWGGRRTLPYAFTEEGIYMLMTVLKGELAINQSKMLIRIFKMMKDYLISNNVANQRYINDMVLKHENKINELFKNIKPQIENKIIYSGQFYDAYSLLLDILESAKNEIIIIDNYIDRKVLNLICKTKTKVIVVSKNMDEELIKKYQKQYNNLIIIKNNQFHDRFIIIDRKILYSCGASFKDIGKSCFSINKIELISIIDDLLKIIF